MEVQNEPIPALDSIFWPSSSNAKERTNKELEWDIRAPFPDTLIFTVGSSAAEFFNCNQMQNKKCHHSSYS